MTPTIQAEIAVIGGGLGGVAAALAAARRGRHVVLTEQYPWLGGQLTSQAVPPDEHSWVEQFGVTASYRALRRGVRDYYRAHYPVTRAAWLDPYLNPGDGHVSRLCHEPRVALAVIEQMLAPHRSSGRLRVMQPAFPVAAQRTGDVVRAVVVKNPVTGREVRVEAPYVLDATETGELLPLTGTEYVVGAEARAEYDEPSAPLQAAPDNVQAITWCFAFDHVPGDHTIERPADYDFWRSYEPPFWGAPLLSFTAPNPRTLAPEPRTFHINPPDRADGGDQRQRGGDMDLWSFRRVLARSNFEPGSFASDIVLANWPMLDYLEGSIIDQPDAARHLAAARSLSLSYAYWLQTEAPRPDGGRGYPGLRLRGDVVGTEDGLAQAPYIRESRRIRAVRTVTEHDISVAVRGHGRPATFDDSVGIGMYRIDLHPSTGGDNYIDVECAPFEIPLSALIPQRTENLLPAAKNIGTTHITNGAYRLHPVEWNIGESAALLADYCLTHGVRPVDVAKSGDHLERFQSQLTAEGVELHWPEIVGY